MQQDEALSRAVRTLYRAMGGGELEPGVGKAATNMLSSMIGGYNVTPAVGAKALRALAGTAPDAEAFKAAYDRADSASKAGGLDRYLVVLGRIAQDPQLRGLLTRQGGHGARSTSDEAGRPRPVAGAAAAPAPASRMASTPPASPQRSHARPSPQGSPARVVAAPDDKFRTRANVLYEGGARGDGGEGAGAGTGGAADAGRRPDTAYERPLAAATTAAAATAAATSAVRALDLGEGPPAAAPAAPSVPAPAPAPAPASTAPGRSSGVLPLGSYDRSTQEALIVDDLLFALGGIDGVYASRKEGPAGSFMLDSTCDVSLAALAARLLPLCADHIAVEAFAARCLGESELPPIGGRLTAQALGAALRAVLRDYDLLLAQLESQSRQGALTLQSMWLWCEPSAAAMRTLAGVVYSAEQAPASRGCALLLDVLEGALKREAGDNAGQQLMQHLLQAAAEPCLAALASWIYRGVVADPYDEFMLVGFEGVSPQSLAEDANSAYWTGRYRLRQEGVPGLLRPLAPLVLAAGKHINAAKDAQALGGGGANLEETDGPLRAQKGALVYSPGHRALEERIMAAQRVAAVRLLKEVKAGGDMLERLRSLKHYFLLDRGDWLVHFLDLAASELHRPTAEVSQNALQGLLTVALHNSAAVDDPFADCVQVALASQPMAVQLAAVVGGEMPEASAARDAVHALDMLTLEYRAPFPLSLVLSRASVFKYQLLFRHLLACHHVQRELRGAWQAQQRSRWGEAQRALMMTCSSGLQRMLHFWRSYEHYVSFEVLEPTWADMENSLAAAPDTDGAMKAHGAFLDRVMALTMLFRPQLVDTLARIRGASLAFAAIAAATAEGTDDATAMAQLRALDAAFEREMGALRERLRSIAQIEPHLAFLATRLHTGDGVKS